MNQFKEAAAKYIAMGMRVFPIRPQSKIPCTPSGVKDATNDLVQIKAWSLRWPDAGIAIAGRNVYEGDRPCSSEYSVCLNK